MSQEYVLVCYLPVSYLKVKHEMDSILTMGLHIFSRKIFILCLLTFYHVMKKCPRVANEFAI